MVLLLPWQHTGVRGSSLAVLYPAHGTVPLQVVSATITVTLRARVLRFEFDGLSGAGIR